MGEKPRDQRCRTYISENKDHMPYKRRTVSFDKQQRSISPHTDTHFVSICITPCLKVLLWPLSPPAEILNACMGIRQPSLGYCTHKWSAAAELLLAVEERG
jgi:hypothetical protein